MNSATLAHNPDAQADDIAVGKSVLTQEIVGLQAVSDSLDTQFSKAVETLFSRTGRVIVTGMGKSGHIARKIAATLASTGTPAHFVHPAEASHGDLGMITEQDAVIALSNSGETAELQDVIAYTRRFDIPLIALVRRKTSTLVESADIAVVLPEIPEASPEGAPTTSTTMMLAYGDALAIALLKRRGFSKEDFGTYHPGGKLGKNLTKVGSLMHGGEELPLAASDLPMQKVLIEMTAKRFGCVGVTAQDGTLLGIITDGDLRRHMGDFLLEQTAEEVMTANPITIGVNMLAPEALHIMQEKSITSLFVVDKHVPVGILHIHDLLRAGVV